MRILPLRAKIVAKFTFFKYIYVNLLKNTYVKITYVNLRKFYYFTFIIKIFGKNGEKYVILHKKYLLLREYTTSLF